MSSSKKLDVSQYAYSEMSSKVTQADRKFVTRRDNEATGEAESLVGKIDFKAMGDRAGKAAGEPAATGQKTQGRKTNDQGTRAPKAKKQRQNTTYPTLANQSFTNILDAEALEGVYRPRSAETEQVFQLILNAVQRILGDQPQAVIRDATDYTLTQLRNDDLKDVDKKREIEDVIGPFDNELFSQLLSLAKRLTDFNDDAQAQSAVNVDEDQGEIDEDGVALLFEDEDEESDDQDQSLDEDQLSDDDIMGHQLEDNAEVKAEVEDGDRLVLGPSHSSTSKTKADSVSLSAKDIDAFWLQRLVGNYYPDPVTAIEITNQIIAVLESDSLTRECEDALMAIFNYEYTDLVPLLTTNRQLIAWCTKLQRASEDEKINIRVSMREQGLGWILKSLDRVGQSDVNGEAEDHGKETVGAEIGNIAREFQTLDLGSMAFAEGGHFKANTKVILPKGSTKITHKSYEEIHVPPPSQYVPPSGSLVSIDSLPSWCHDAFHVANVTSLNPIQSKIFPTAFNSDEPILVCAPTGAGKTNIAVLTILRCLDNFRDPQSNAIALDQFKIVYVAPMKALVQEMVTTFTKRLTPFGITVAELTGDSQLTKQQISETQVIVTTPEKWDVITRKSNDLSYTNLVRLMIIDEIHLLHDDRGPVLESIIARTIRRSESTASEVRLVGLSATLPNYQDVATFLRADQSTGVFYFDGTYRPCPLEQQFIGVSEKKAMKRLQVMNEVCYEKTLATAGKSQTIIFVHSRKETVKTAGFIRDMAIEKDTASAFIGQQSASQSELKRCVELVSDQGLKDLLPFGFAFHHAGMNRNDRSIVEQAFADRHIQVLVSTATLAWGVNLPAHTVIIKGTQVYNPEKGSWCELSPQDVLQMLGRAGRPSYDTSGEGIIITNQPELQYYLSLLNEQLPIESQLISKLADNLNAEIVLGTIRNREEAVNWLGYTYLFIRMLKNKALYGITVDYEEEDESLTLKRSDIIHTAACILEKTGLIKYNRQSGQLLSTDLGRIASYYYVTHASMATYNQLLKPNMSMIDLFRVFALSNEFKLIPVRAEEKVELARLVTLVPVPIKESIEEPAAKINVLLQTYISQKSLDVYALLADMVFIQQSAARILRAMFEICLKRKWAAPTKLLLSMSKMVEKRMWSAFTPLRQFDNCPAEVIRRAEQQNFPWFRYFDLTPDEIGTLLRLPRSGAQIHNLVHKVPKVQLELSAMPITRSILRIDLTITPDFQWDDRYHHGSEQFWILVEDVDGEILLYQDRFILNKRFMGDSHLVSLTIPITEPITPSYFLSVISDRWLHSETRIPISCRDLILPAANPPHTRLLDLQPLAVTALQNAEYQSAYAEIAHFNKVQTQAFQALYTTSDNVLVAAPAGSGRNTCLDLALMRHWSSPQSALVCICIEPYVGLVKIRALNLRHKFAGLVGKTISAFTDDDAFNQKLLRNSDVIVATPSQWDAVSRKWLRIAALQKIGLLLAKDIHLVGSDIGAAYEAIISRTRSISAQTEVSTRIVATSVPLASGRDMADWLGCSNQNTFNFSPAARSLPIDIDIQTFNTPHFPSLMLTMVKPLHLAIQEKADGRPVICFTPSAQQCIVSATDLLTQCVAEGQPSLYLGCELEEIESQIASVSDEALRETLKHGIGMYHEMLTEQDKLIVQRLYEAEVIPVIFASRDVAWSMPLTAYMVVLLGVQYYCGQEHRYADYAIADVLQMIGHAGRTSVDESSRCVLLLQTNRKDFFLKFLRDALPVESQLHYALQDHFNAEIANRVIEDKQQAVNYLTWTYLYRRFARNPNFYELPGTSQEQQSEHIRLLIERNIDDLIEAHCVEEGEELDLTATNLGVIASHYYISPISVSTFQASFTAGTKLRGVLEILVHAEEFESVPIRKTDANTLLRLYDRLPVKLAPSRVNPQSPAFKTHVLLQAHFSRMTLTRDLAIDQEYILSKAIKLLAAAVDVMFSNTFLNATYAMDLSQMIVQATWDFDSPLKQVPHITPEIILRCKAANVNGVYDIANLEDDERTQILQLPARQVRDVAAFTNSYPPPMELTASVMEADEVTSGEPIKVSVTVEPDLDEDEEELDATVVAPFYPRKKMTSWWIIIGDNRSRQMHVIKKVTITKKLTVVLTINELPAGKHDLQLLAICDSYMGADLSTNLTINVAQGDDEEEEEEDGDVAMQ